MKHIFIFFSFMLLQVASFSQHKSNEILDSTSKIKAVSFQYDLENTEKNTDTIKLSFTEVSFKDVRYDTSFIAINWQSGTSVPVFGMYNKKFTFYGGLAKSLTGYAK